MLAVLAWPWSKWGGLGLQAAESDCAVAAIFAIFSTAKGKRLSGRFSAETAEGVELAADNGPKFPSNCSSWQFSNVLSRRSSGFLSNISRYVQPYSRSVMLTGIYRNNDWFNCCVCFLLRLLFWWIQLRFSVTSCVCGLASGGATHSTRWRRRVASSTLNVRFPFFIFFGERVSEIFFLAFKSEPFIFSSVFR